MFQKIFDVVFPKTCVICKTYGDWCCHSCFNTVVVEPRVTVVGDLCVITSTDFKQTVVQKLLYAFKYDGVEEAGAYLAEILRRGLASVGTIHESPLHEYDAIIPIPLHRRRLLERGYNQNAVIARRCFGADRVREDAVARARYTKSQTGLTREARRENIKDCFRVTTKEIVRGKKIILIDDVLTTGATLVACRDVLSSAGARDIIGLAVARD